MIVFHLLLKTPDKAIKRFKSKSSEIVLNAPAVLEKEFVKLGFKPCSIKKKKVVTL